MKSEGSLVRACVALASSSRDATEGERLLVAQVMDLPAPAPGKLDTLRRRIVAGFDPLGDAFASLRDAETRRPLGQVYTPKSIVKAMVAWAVANGEPARIVDPGVGSGRFLLAAAKVFPKAELIGADIDPLALLMARTNLAVIGATERTDVRLVDYRSLSLENIDGKTLFLGNPPYVRHHNITPEWKTWLLATAKKRGLPASALAGLHAHFFLATAEHAREGDYGAFVTSSEWLDVNYGSLVRALLVNDLGGVGLHVIEPDGAPFEGTATTAVIATFAVGTSANTMKVRRVGSSTKLGTLSGGKNVKRERLAEASRWTPLIRTSVKLPSDFIELGELCRVHRGTVTGSNATWVARGDVDIPGGYLIPSVTKARELFAAGNSIDDDSALRRVINLPIDLDGVPDDYRDRVDAFLRRAKREGVHLGYVASKRRAWWSVGMREPAPILATYMARRPPAFVRNQAEARHINIAHGLYPREAFTPEFLDALASTLRDTVTLEGGRVYAGGLTKFEPREMERLAIPMPEVLVGDR